MGGWADGVNAKMLGIPDPAIVWVGYNDRASTGLSTYISIEERPGEGGGQQVWAEMTLEGWKHLRAEIDTAISTIEEDEIERNAGT